MKVGKMLVFSTEGNVDFADCKTNRYSLELRTIEDGILKGSQYYRARDRLNGASINRFPRDFVLNDFLSLDAEDKEALLWFQGKYGIIGFLAFVCHYDRRQNRYVSLQRYPECTELQLIAASEKEACAKTLAINSYLNEQGKREIATVVSADEVMQVVFDLQNMIKSTIEVKKDTDSITTDLLFEPMSRSFVALANNLKAELFPPYRLLDVDRLNEQRSCISLQSYIVLSHMEALGSKEIRRCGAKGCGRLFVLEKNNGRRFCSSECQNREKARVWRSQHKKKEVKDDEK